MAAHRRLPLSPGGCRRNSHCRYGHLLSRCDANLARPARWPRGSSWVRRSCPSRGIQSSVRRQPFMSARPWPSRPLSWVFLVAGREIVVRSRRARRYHEAEMNQGSPILGSPIADLECARFAKALDLRGEDLHSLPMQVVSTGLPYMIVPVARGYSGPGSSSMISGSDCAGGGEVCLRL